MPPREEELQQEAEARAAAAAQQDDEEVELGDADFGTDSPPRGAARWRHGGNKAEHVPRAAEPDTPVSYDSPGVARPGEGRLRVIGSGMRMKKASLRVIFIFGHRMGDQFWHACTSVRQRLTKLRSMQALVMSSQEGSTQLGS